MTDEMRRSLELAGNVVSHARRLDRARRQRPGRLGEMVPGPLPLADRFTLGHGMVGACLGLAGVPWWFALAVAVGWDVIENPLKRALPRVFPDQRPDTLPHVAVDISAWMLGYGLMKLLPPGPVPDIWK